MASIRDVLLISIILFASGITLFYSVSIGHSVNTQLKLIPVINSSTPAVNVINSADSSLNSTDYIYLASFIALAIGIIITGWFISGLPIIAPIYFFVLIIFTFVGVILQKVWVDLATTDTINAQLTNLPITNFILSNLGIFTAVIGIVAIIVMFAKPSANQGVY